MRGRAVNGNGQGLRVRSGARQAWHRRQLRFVRGASAQLIARRKIPLPMGADFAVLSRYAVFHTFDLRGRRWHRKMIFGRNVYGQLQGRG